MTRFRLTIGLLALFLLSFTIPVFAQDGLQLTKTYTSSDKQLSFQYPDGWTISANSETIDSLDVSVSSTASAVNRDPVISPSDSMSAGEVRINISTAKRNTIAQFSAVSSDASLSDILDGLVKQIEKNAGSDLTFATSSPTTFGGHDAARVSFTAGKRSEGFLALVDLGGDFLGGIGVYAAPGELQHWEATALAVTASLTSAGEATPSVEPTAESTNGGSSGLSKTFTSSDGKISFQYPSDWAFEADGQSSDNLSMNIGSVQASLDKDPVNDSTTVMAPGEVRVNITTVTREAIAKIVDVSADASLSDMLNGLIAFLSKNESTKDEKFTSDGTTTIGGFQAARASYNIPNRAQGYVILIELGNGLIAGVAVYAAPGELSQQNPTLTAILNSITVAGSVTPSGVLTVTPSVEATAEGPSAAALKLDKTYSTPDQTFSFQYPSDWTISAGDETVATLSISVGTTASAVEKNPINQAIEVMASGEVRVNVTTQTRTSITNGIGVSADAPLSDILNGFVNALSTSPNFKGEQFSSDGMTTMGGYPAAQISYMIPNRAEGYLVLIDFGTGLVGVVAVYTAPGELSQWGATALAIVNSITYTKGVIPSSEATAESTASSTSLDLSKTYTNPDKQLTFQYPSDWVLDTSSEVANDLSVNVATESSITTADPLEDESSHLTTGQARVNVVTGKKSEIAQVAHTTSDASISDLLSALLKNLSPESSKYVSAVRSITVNGDPAARIDFHVPERGDGFIALVDLGSGVIGGVGLYAAPGESSKWEVTALGILNSLKYGGAAEATTEAASEATAESTDSAALDLTQTYTNDAKNASFMYPADWTIQTPTGTSTSWILNVSIAPTKATLSKQFGTDATYDPGEFILELEIVNSSQLEAFIPASSGVTASSTPVEILTSLFAAAASLSSDITVSKPSAVSLNDQPGGEMHIEEKNKGDGTISLYALPNNIFALVVAFSAPGELAKWDATVQAIENSITVSAAGSTPASELTPTLVATPDSAGSPGNTNPDLTQTYTNDDQTASMMYPTGWVIRAEPVPPGTLFNVTIGNSQAAIDTSLSSGKGLAPGEVAVLVTVVTQEQVLQIPGISASDKPTVILDTLIHASVPSDAGMTATQATPITLNGQDGAQMFLDDNGEHLGSGVLLLRSDGLYVFSAIVGAPGELAQWSDVYQAILNSITVNTGAAPEATSSVTAEATPESTSSAALELTQTYTNDLKNGSFMYPSQWVIRPQSSSSVVMSATVATTETALRKNPGTSDVYAPGEVAVQVEVVTPDQLRQIPGAKTDLSPVELLDTLFQQAGAVPADMTVGKASAVTINGLDGAQVHIDEKGKLEGSIYAYLDQGDYVLIEAISAPGELANWDATIQAIAASVTLSATAEATASVIPESTDEANTSYTTGDQHLSVSYPFGWVTKAAGQDGVYLADQQSALGHQLGTAFASGEVQVFVIANTIANLTPQINLGLQADASADKLTQALIKATSSFLKFDKSVETTVNGLTAVSTVFHGKGFDGQTYVIEFGNKVVGLVQVLAAPGELPPWDGVVQRILASLKYTP